MTANGFSSFKNDGSGMSRIDSAVSEFVATLPSPDLFAVLGATAIAIVAILLVVLLVLVIFTLSRRLQQASSEAAMRNDETPGNKIMIAHFSGSKGGSVRRQLGKALETYLPEFNFGSPFYIGYCGLKLDAIDFAYTEQDHARLKALFEASGADLIAWGGALPDSKAQRLCFTTRDMIATNRPQAFFMLTLEGDVAEWGEDELRTMAYVAGRRLRPALGRPADFRADRLMPILHAMEKLLNAETPPTGRAAVELEEDFAAGALHVGDQVNSLEWLDKAASLRARMLSQMKPDDNLLRWSRAKIDLGRAMCLQYEHKFESAKLQDGMNHVREGIEAGRADPRLKYTETGVAALRRAEGVLESRRRFSIRWNN